MLGIVLWADHEKSRAVVWCEDHANLAFYRADQAADTRLDVGDLIRFDLEMVDAARHVRRPELVFRDHLAELPEELKNAVTRLRKQQALEVSDAGRVLALQRGAA